MPATAGRSRWAARWRRSASSSSVDVRAAERARRGGFGGPSPRDARATIGLEVASRAVGGGERDQEASRIWFHPLSSAVDVLGAFDVSGATCEGARRRTTHDSERGEATHPPPPPRNGARAPRRRAPELVVTETSSELLLARSRAPRPPSPPALPRPTPRAADAPRRQDLQRAVDSPRSLRKQWALRRRASRPCSARPTTSAPGRAPCGGRALGITSNATAAS